MSISNNTVEQPRASYFFILYDDALGKLLEKTDDLTLRACRLVSNYIRKIATQLLNKKSVKELSNIQNQLREKFPYTGETRITLPFDESYPRGVNNLAKNLLNTIREDKEFKTFSKKQLPGIEQDRPLEAFKKIIRKLSLQQRLEEKKPTIFRLDTPVKKNAFEPKSSKLCSE